MKHRTTALVLVGSVLVGSVVVGSVLAGCSSATFVEEKLPEASAFRAGSCATAAEDTVALGRLSQRNRTSKALPDTDRIELKNRQNALVNLRSTVDGELSGPLEKLIVAVGFVRIRADSNTYGPQLLSDLDKARREVQAVCVPA